MWILLYSILLHVVFAASLPWLLFRAWKTGKLRSGLGERFGAIAAPWLREAASARPIWIHAVSVGEAQMLGPVIEGLTKRYPGVPIVISTNTTTGKAIADSYPEPAGTFFIPLDFGWAIRRLIKRLSPRILVIMETEIWPNLIVQSSRMEVPVVFLNGRISDHSLPGYKKARFFLWGVLNKVAAFGMRSESDAERIVSIGAPEDRIEILGNLKFESAYGLVEDPNPFSRDSFGLAEDATVLIGGSTFPNEETMLIRIYDACRKKHPNLRLLLAPRHPRRFEQVKEDIVESGRPVFCRSQGTPDAASDSKPPIVLLDVMGELKKVYRPADLVYIGKSMGLSKKGYGGQNPLEAAAWSKPILCGPHMANFREVARQLETAGGLDVVNDEKALMKKVEELLADASQRETMGRSASSVIKDSLGAADRCLDLIEKVLDRT